jgi:glucose-6-phosphate isomerase
MRYEQLSTLCFAASPGGPGISEADYSRALARTAPALAQIKGWQERGEQPFLSYPDKDDDLAELEDMAQSLRRRFARVAIIGVGGASLGGQAVTALASGSGADRTPLIFLDNPDSARLHAVLNDDADSGFVVISKSGATAETLAQTMIALERAAAERFLFITSPGDNPLRRIAEARGVAVLDHDPDLGGRFSVFSAVGVLPLLLAGLDGAAFRRGASETLHAALRAAEPGTAPPAVGAALNLGMAPNISATVFMPYDDRLLGLSQWICQLSAESLGKNGHGTTPVVARGAVDQHSQLQLYLDGPSDKLFTLLRVEAAADGTAIDADLAALAGADYLAGRSLAQLMAAEAAATRDALAEGGRPVREFILPVLDEAALGAVMMHFMLETVVMALCLDIDPFDQPAVERGKELAREYLLRART